MSRTNKQYKMNGKGVTITGPTEHGGLFTHTIEFPGMSDEAEARWQQHVGIGAQS
jgi:hypothetical protein